MIRLKTLDIDDNWTSMWQNFNKSLTLYTCQDEELSKYDAILDFESGDIIFKSSKNTLTFLLRWG